MVCAKDKGDREIKIKETGESFGITFILPTAEVPPACQWRPVIELATSLYLNLHFVFELMVVVSVVVVIVVVVVTSTFGAPPQTMPYNVIMPMGQSGNCEPARRPTF